MSAPLFAVRWVGAEGDGGPAVRLLDQTRLPGEARVLDCHDLETLAEAIRALRVRGAPALGVTAGYGVVLGALTGWEPDRAAAHLAAQRPTAVNLGWAAARVAAAGPDPDAMLAEAERIDADNDAACRAIGRHGADLLADRCGAPLRVLTHCNTGVLACQGIGTAFAVARTLHERGALAELLVDETRPLLQGARLTAYEAAALGMPHSVLADAAAGGLMAAGEVDAVVVGADRVAADGSVANKVGTYSLAVLAARHGLPMIVAAPASTIDAATASGADIVIEERPAAEVRHAGDSSPLIPAASAVRNPAFDVTPPELVTAVVTERGVHVPDGVAAVAASSVSPAP